VWPNWKAECGETRLLRLERGKGRKALPIAIGRLFPARSPQLNANPLGGGHPLLLV